MASAPSGEESQPDVVLDGRHLSAKSFEDNAWSHSALSPETFSDPGHLSFSGTNWARVLVGDWGAFPQEPVPRDLIFAFGCQGKQKPGSVLVQPFHLTGDVKTLGQGSGSDRGKCAHSLWPQVAASSAAEAFLLPIPIG